MGLGLTKIWSSRQFLWQLSQQFYRSWLAFPAIRQFCLKNHQLHQSSLIIKTPTKQILVQISLLFSPIWHFSSWLLSIWCLTKFKILQNWTVFQRLGWFTYISTLHLFCWSWANFLTFSCLTDTYEKRQNPWYVQIVLRFLCFNKMIFFSRFMNYSPGW